MDHKIKFIAEIGMNYNSNFDLCYELIKQAKYAGADIVKFQLGWRAKKNEINHLDKAKLLKLIKWSNDFDVELLFSIFDQKSFDLLKNLNFKKFKIPSRLLLNDFDLIKQVLKFSNETIISLGMWNKKKLPIKNSKIKYLWCRSNYPTHNEHLINFPKKFDSKKYYGYSDHAIGIEVCLIAITRGAKIIEKHFTLDKSDNHIRDHALSATPEEFLKLTQLGKEISNRLKYGI